MSWPLYLLLYNVSEGLDILSELVYGNNTYTRIVQNNSCVYGKNKTTYLHLVTANGKRQTRRNRDHVVGCRKRVLISLILLLPPGWDASPSQGYPQHYDRRYPFIHLGEERQCGIKLLVWGNNTTAVPRLEPPTSRSEVQRANH